MKKAIILDRDGTIIVDKIYLNDATQVEYFPRVFEALQRLRDFGFIFVIATNQSGLAKGIVDIRNMDLIHARIAHDFAKYGVYFAGFYYAPFATTNPHLRRKPNPGMLQDAARDHRISLPDSWMIGDRMTDVEAGHRAGARTLLLEGVESPNQSKFAPPEAFLKDLYEASLFIEKYDRKFICTNMKQ